MRRWPVLARRGSTEVGGLISGTFKLQRPGLLTHLPLTVLNGSARNGVPERSERVNLNGRGLGTDGRRASARVRRRALRDAAL